MKDRKIMSRELTFPKKALTAVISVSLKKGMRTGPTMGIMTVGGDMIPCRS